jgi:hypothetical protein
MHTARIVLLPLLGASLAASCAHSSWPDEPGVAVELAQAENVEAAALFLDALTSRRRAAGLSDPIVIPLYQDDMRHIAEDLQSGKVSAKGAERTVLSWAKAAFGRDVETFALDCAAGKPMSLPDLLVEEPFIVVNYAAAQFRPRSSQTRQCAVLAIVRTGSEPVEKATLR